MVGAMFMACDKVNEETKPDLDYGEADTELEKPAKPVGDPLTPEESRTKLEETGKELTELLKPESQQELLEVINEFYAISQDMEFEYRGFIEQAMQTLLEPMRQVARSNVKAVSEYESVHDIYIYGLDQATGIYTHDGAQWTYTESDQKLELNFKVNGQETIISVIPSGETYEYEYTYEYTIEEWDYENGKYVEIPYKETTIVRVPGKIEASVVKGGNTLASLLIEGKYKVATNDPIMTDVNLVMGSYNVKASAIVSKSAITERILFTIDGQTVLNTKAEAEGNFNLDPEYYMIDDEPEYYSVFLNVKNAEFVTKVLDLRLAAGCKDIQKLEKDYRRLEATIAENESDYALEAGTPYSLSQPFVNDMCQLFNEGLNFEASYGDGPTFAKLQLKAQYYEKMNYWDIYNIVTEEYDWDEDGIIDDTWTYHEGKDICVEGYEPMPVLVFTDDGASFSIMEFFNENDFANVIKDFDNLIALYENCLPNINVYPEEYPEY